VINDNVAGDYWLVKMQYVFYADQDHDGFGNVINSTVASLPPLGYVTDPFDCNDQSNSLNPSEPDVADGIDNNCDGSIDEPSIVWQTSLGGSEEDYAYSLTPSQDGGYVVAGHSFSSDGDVTGHHGDALTQDVWITKINGSGSLQWAKSFGGSYQDGARSIKTTADGGYIVAGFNASTDGDVSGHHGLSQSYDYWVLKLNLSGGLQWQKSLGGTHDDIAYAVEQTPDGGYIVAGISQSNNGDVTVHYSGNSTYDWWIVKLDANGNLVWQKTLGGSSNDWCTDIHATPDGGYIVGGYSYSHDHDLTSNKGQSDYWIVKLDGTGNILWQKSYGGSTYDNLNALQLTADGGYIVTGDSQSDDVDVDGHHDSYGTYDGWVVKIDINGNMVWNKSIGGFSFDLLLQ
jgi:hypothetical protein